MRAARASGRRGPRGLAEIEARKAELASRCAAQRAELAEAIAGLAPAFAKLDRVGRAARSLLSHPLLLAGAAGLLLALWPRRVLSFVGRAFAARQGLGGVRRLLSRPA